MLNQKKKAKINQKYNKKRTLQLKSVLIISLKASLSTLQLMSKSVQVLLLVENCLSKPLSKK